MTRIYTKRIPSRIGDISDLPEAVRKVVAGHSEINVQIIDVIRSLDGAANVDEIIVFLFRRHGVMTTSRRELASRLYRMTVLDQLVSIKGRKGVFGLSTTAMLRKTK